MPNHSASPRIDSAGDLWIAGDQLHLDRIRHAAAQARPITQTRAIIQARASAAVSWAIFHDARGRSFRMFEDRIEHIRVSTQNDIAAAPAAAAAAPVLEDSSEQDNEEHSSRRRGFSLRRDPDDGVDSGSVPAGGSSPSEDMPGYPVVDAVEHEVPQTENHTDQAAVGAADGKAFASWSEFQSHLQNDRAVLREGEDEMCGICMQPWDDEATVPIHLQPCNHLFCRECALRWFEMHRSKNNTNKCPYCRAVVFHRPRATRTDLHRHADTGELDGSEFRALFLDEMPPDIDDEEYFSDELPPDTDDEEDDDDDEDDEEVDEEDDHGEDDHEDGLGANVLYEPELEGEEPRILTWPQLLEELLADRRYTFPSVGDIIGTVFNHPIPRSTGTRLPHRSGHMQYQSPAATSPLHSRPLIRLSPGVHLERQDEQMQRQMPAVASGLHSTALTTRPRYPSIRVGCRPAPLSTWRDHSVRSECGLRHHRYEIREYWAQPAWASPGAGADRAHNWM